MHAKVEEVLVIAGVKSLGLPQPSPTSSIRDWTHAGQVSTFELHPIPGLF